MFVDDINNKLLIISPLLVECLPLPNPTKKEEKESTSVMLDDEIINDIANRIVTEIENKIARDVSINLKSRRIWNLADFIKGIYLDFSWLNSFVHPMHAKQNTLCKPLKDLFLDHYAHYFLRLIFSRVETFAISRIFRKFHMRIREFVPLKPLK